MCIRDRDIALPLAGIQVVDVDNAVLTTKVLAENGTLNLGSMAGVTVTGLGTDTITLVGSGVDITAALATLSFAPVADYNGPASVSLATYEGTSPPNSELWLSDPTGNIIKIDLAPGAIPSATNDVLVGSSGIVPFDMAFAPDGQLYACLLYTSRCV